MASDTVGHLLESRPLYQDLVNDGLLPMQQEKIAPSLRKISFFVFVFLVLSFHYDYDYDYDYFVFVFVKNYLP